MIRGMAMLLGFQLAKLNVCSAMERGLAMGAASHGEGTTRILPRGRCVSSLAMGLTALAMWQY